LSSEAYSKHGINPSVVIFDELHAQPNRELWDVMTFGSGDARKEPLYWVITTAGDDPDRNSIGWEIHDKAQRVINGELDLPSWYAKIYGAPEDADIYDEKVWHLCNPSLGFTINIDDFREAAEGAKVSQAAEKLFRWLKLNQWVSLKRTSWLPLTLWDATESDHDKENLIGMKCYAGLDLSSTTDITALCLLFPPQIGLDRWTAIFDAWLPIESMKERVARDHVPYDTWYKQKYLTCTPGNVIDYDFIQLRLQQLTIQYGIEIIAYDPYHATQLMVDIENDDKITAEVSEVAQTIKILSPAMKEIERLMRSQQFAHEKNPLARWCFGNLVVFVDGNENLKPMKNRSHERIDVIVAMIDAMAIAMKFEDMKSECPYTAERGILVM
jgi:phage terminase large subunit-like protein